MKLQLRKRRIREEGKTFVYFFFFVDGKEVGNCHVDGDEILWSFRIYSRFRKKGYGELFLQRLMQDKDAPTMLYVGPFRHLKSEKILSSQRLIKFYQKAGFKLAGYEFHCMEDGEPAGLCMEVAE
jgi:GNAT superfamily N-acetyltransferase